MTTIAYKDGLFCADSLMANHVELLVTTSPKIHKIKDGWLGGCGNPRDVQKLLHLLESIETEKMNVIWSDTGFTGMEVTNTGEIYLWNSELVPVQIKHKFYAVGSGADLAMGAMEYGATAYEAVKIASKYDAYTGGRIQKVKVL